MLGRVLSHGALSRGRNPLWEELAMNRWPRQKAEMPLPPCQDSVESMQVYKQHCQIAEEYHEVKKEIALLEERKKELIAKLDQAEKEKVDAAQLVREFEALTEENRTLKLAQSQCVEQLEKLRIQYQKRQGSS
ncbi:PREDICTED: MAP3K7 C-terminal-like protein isoform X2 [Galeopterus variegatus]|uniref:MAP3K7 C-terminal-like protein isoform X2 n=1 Tax=Galeopterus variegatus TaxID=482537 RepID=A0ABM0S8K7_GALVR|nr:PREDICTED: MAP3K7 C-terminal-like protein isoform X2 [Galeopterus variegatus]